MDDNERRERFGIGTETVRGEAPKLEEIPSWEPVVSWRQYAGAFIALAFILGAFLGHAGRYTKAMPGHEELRHWQMAGLEQGVREGAKIGLEVCTAVVNAQGDPNLIQLNFPTSAEWQDVPPVSEEDGARLESY